MNENFIKGIHTALQAIADLQYGETEDETNGHEAAYRAVESLVPVDQRKPIYVTIKD